MKKVFIFDLDGTLTPHRTWISEEHISLLDELKNRGARVVVIGAGRARRIYTQMRDYPCDIIGNYGLQLAKYRDEKGDIELIRDKKVSCDKDSIRRRVLKFREKTGYTDVTGEGVYFYPSGLIRIPLLGRGANVADKLELDPDKRKRCELLPILEKSFRKYNIFVAGSTSFDLSPKPYDKLYAIREYLESEGFTAEDAVFFGDNYKNDGNDQCVFYSEIESVPVDKPEQIFEFVKPYID